MKLWCTVLLGIITPLCLLFSQALLDAYPVAAAASSVVQPVEVLEQQTNMQQATAQGAVPAMQPAASLSVAGTAFFHPVKGSHHPAATAVADDDDLVKLTMGSFSSQLGHVQVCMITK